MLVQKCEIPNVTKIGKVNAVSFQANLRMRFLNIALIKTTIWGDFQGVNLLFVQNTKINTFIKVRCKTLFIQKLA